MTATGKPRYTIVGLFQAVKTSKRKSAKAIAMQVGVNPTTAARLARGEMRDIPGSLVRKYASALGVSVSTVLEACEAA